MTLPSNCLAVEPAATPSDPLVCFGGPAQSSEAAAAGTPFASLLTQADATGANAGTAATSEPTPYPGIFYMPFAGSQAAAAAAPGAAVDPVQVVANSSVQTAAAGKKPETAQEPASKEKQKTPAKSSESSTDDAGQNAMQLAYQFIAGQWVPQTVVDEQVASLNLETQTGSPVSTASSFVASGSTLLQNGQSEQGQSAAQPKAELATPVTAQNREATAPAAAKPNDQVATGLQPAPAKEKPADSSTQPATADAGASAQAWRLQSSRLQAQEKIAAPALPSSTEFASGVNSSSDAKEKKTVVDGIKGLTFSKPNVGTDTANRENAMPHSAVNKASSVVLPSTFDDGIRAGNSPAVAQVEGSVAAHAPKLVQEIRQIADRISAIDRNTVEVRFDFSDTDRLSVRVEYRDGAVHTTFRTDSSQLRDAISQEWQAQGAVSDQKSYRMTEPVFSQTASDRQSFSSTSGDGSDRQRAFEQASPSATPSYASSGRNVGSGSSVATPAARSLRPETSLHLHALA